MRVTGHKVWAILLIVAGTSVFAFARQISTVNHLHGHGFIIDILRRRKRIRYRSMPVLSAVLG